MKKVELSKALLLCALLLVFAIGSAESSTEKYPSKTIEAIVGWEPGGGVDAMFRIIAKHLSKELGKPIIIVNKPGGGSIPAVLDVMNAKPDGYTLLVDLQALSTYQIGRKDIPFNPLERTYICKIGQSPYVLFSDPKLNWKSLSDAAAFIKEQPEKFTWGALGGPSGVNYSQLQFFDIISADIKKTKMVVHKGSGPILTAAAGGHVMFGSSGAAPIPPFHQSGKVKCLVVTGDQTLKVLPGVPSAKETKFPGLNVHTWIGLSGPPKLPQEVVDTINNAVKKMVHLPELIADLEKVCSIPFYADPETLRKSVIEESKSAQKFLEIMGEK